jgi:putative oxidoreductase
MTSTSHPTDVTLAPATHGLRARWNALAATLDRLVAHDLLAIGARLAVAAIFFYSGRTKVDGWLTLNGNAVELFKSEYNLPWIDAELAAHLAAYSEHLFPLLLVLGLATRLSALALLGMTAVIQLFVYPDAWPTHLSWAVLMLYLVGRGAGRWSMDRAIGVR